MIAFPDWTALLIMGLGMLVVGLVNFDYPGVQVTETTRGSIPIDQLAFHTAKMIGTALRGPVNTPMLITSMRQYAAIFGPRTDTSYLDDAARAWIENVSAPMYVSRVVGTGSAQATATLSKSASSATWTVTVGSGVTTFTLTFSGQTTSSLTASGLTAAAVQTALEALSSVGASNCTVSGNTGGPFTVTLAGTLANTNEPAAALTAAGTGGTVTVSQTDPGGPTTAVLQFTSLGPGVDYNYVSSPAHGISVTYSQGTLTVFDAGVAIEVYRQVTFGNAAFSAQQINGGSNVIQVAWLNTTVNPDDVTIPVGLTGGSDGAAVNDATFAGDPAATPPTGVYAFADKKWPLGFIMCPGITSQTVGNALIDLAENFRSLALIDSTFGNSISQAQSERDLYAATQGHALYCYGWVQTPDIDTGALKWVPRSPYRAAHIARSHSLPGNIANVGAGVDFRLRNVAALEVVIDDITHGELNVNGIDVARNFSKEGYGLVHWAARTISPNPLYRFLQVRVIFNVLAESIEQGLKPYVFRPIDGKNRLVSEIQGSLNQLLWNMWDQGALFGDNASDAFLVKVETANLSVLEQGILPIEVYAKPTPIAERIAVTLFRVPLSFDFTTGEVAIGDIEQLS